MIRLNLPKEPYWLDFANGVRVLVRPLTMAVYVAAQSRAVSEAAELRDHAAALTGAGAEVSGLPDMTDEHARHGVIQMLISEALAEYGIVDWQGVGLADGSPAPVTPESARAFARQPRVGNRFLLRYAEPLAELELEGNGYGPASNGTSVAGPHTARPAVKPGSTAPKAARSKAKKAKPAARIKITDRKATKAGRRGGCSPRVPGNG